MTDVDNGAPGGFKRLGCLETTGFVSCFVKPEVLDNLFDDEVPDAALVEEKKDERARQASRAIETNFRY